VSEQNKWAKVEKEILRTTQLLKDLKLSTSVQKAKIKCPIKMKSWGLNSEPHSTTWTLFCVGYFWDRVLWTICPGWPQSWTSWSLPLK
jgi:hypothetical protein